MISHAWRTGLTGGKLSSEQVQEIALLLRDSHLTQTEIAIHFKVSQSTVCRINKGAGLHCMPEWFSFPIRAKSSFNKNSSYLV